MNERALAVLLSLALGAFSLGACGDEERQDRGEPQEDFVLSITWKECERLVRREAGFSVSTGPTSSSVSTHMDGGFENYECDEPMELPLERAESYHFDVEGLKRTWTYEELEEQDFRISW